MLFPQGTNGLREEGTAGSFAWQELAVLTSDREQFTAAFHVSAASTGEEEPGGLGVLGEGKGPEGDSGAAELHVPHERSCVPGGSPAKHSRRAALARGSQMGHKFLLRIVAC